MYFSINMYSNLVMVHGRHASKCMEILSQSASKFSRAPPFPHVVVGESLLLKKSRGFTLLAR